MLVIELIYITYQFALVIYCAILGNLGDGYVIKMASHRGGGLDEE